LLVLQPVMGLIRLSMKNEKDLNRIAAIERAIAKKYGKEAIQNPRANWDEEKEKEYLKQLKELAQKERRTQEASEKVLVNGVLVSKKLLNKEPIGSCPVCNKYTRKVGDDIAMAKYDCCNDCYIKWVEHREERWLGGWRPNEGNIKTDS